VRETLLAHFEPNSVMVTGGMICFVMAVMLFLQARHLSAYKNILVALSVCLIGGTTALFLAVADSGHNLPIRMIAANVIGTIVYILGMYCFAELYQPSVHKPFGMVLAIICLVGSIVFLDVRDCYIWAQTSRVVVMLYTAALVIRTYDPDAPGLRWFAIFMTLGSAMGMFPQIIALIELPPDAKIVLVDPTSAASFSQAMLWACSPSLVYACITSIIYARISRRLSNSANIDMLTGAFSRRYLIENGTQVLDERRQFLPEGAASLLLIDVDHFKKINDTYGHLVGDAMLQHCVQCIKDSVRASDSIVGRYGGEEFCVLLPKTPLAGASIVAERIRANVLASAYLLNGQVIPMTVSIGVVLQETDATLSSMISIADQRLYKAKQSGRNQVIDWGGAAVPLPL
jgi:diguanylate cyclase (GGDEF)-like protein